ncbi:GlsB/YeaQ/YmgE family stress response membrane protein [Aeromicrobium sp. CTD01-1L150]|uniref:GlsB/YeaQ/YmgE family stress response membrane protein n=1 Tax=Aeromicrobium sp. CTD01-1L150 TaxID=3341830 RepID=UPI0035BEE6E6
MGIITLLIVGLIAGALARFLVPGKDPMGIIATIILGVVGSFVGGMIGSLFSDSSVLDFNTSGLVMSVIGAIVALLIYRQFSARS